MSHGWSGRIFWYPASNADENLDALLDSADGQIWCLWLSTHHVCWVNIAITVEVKARKVSRGGRGHKVNYSAIGTEIILPPAHSTRSHEERVFGFIFSGYYFCMRISQERFPFISARAQMCCDSSSLCLELGELWSVRWRMAITARDLLPAIWRDPSSWIPITIPNKTQKSVFLRCASWVSIHISQ